MRNGTLTINQLVRAADRLTTPIVEELAKLSKEDHVKYGDLSLGQVEAVLNHFLKDTPDDLKNRLLDSLIHGEARVEVNFIDIIRPFFDKNGRAIKRRGMAGWVCDPDPKRRIQSTKGKELTLLETAIRVFTAVFKQSPTNSSDELRELNRKIMALKGNFWSNSEISNLFEGPVFPIILPRIDSAKDYGTNLWEILYSAVRPCYQKAYPGREFDIQLDSSQFTRRVIAVSERHKQLIADLHDAPVVGLLAFPFQGFSINAQREFASLLPEQFSLAGPLEIAVAECFYPELLGRGDIPVLNCSAVQWEVHDISLCFQPLGEVRLDFRETRNISHHRPDESGALFIRA